MVAADIPRMSAGDFSSVARGARLLLAHCASLNRDGDGPAPVERLRQLLGAELTRLLLVALAGDHGMRSRGLPG